MEHVEKALGYRATRMEDGTLIIHHVPIFTECERGELKCDSAWLTKAVAMAKAQQVDGYCPPLHVWHHDADPSANLQVRASGYFKILSAEPITMKGQRKLAIYADLYVTDPATQDEILRKRLPYRSVEIFPDDAPAIGSLALLDHEAPFLQLPMLMVQDVKEASGTSGDTIRASYSLHALQSEDPSLACFRHQNKARWLFREDFSMDQKTTTTGAQEAEQAKLFMDDGEEKKKDEEKMQEGEGSGIDVSSIVKAIESGEISVKDMDAIKAAILKQESAAETPAEEEPAMAPVPGGESMKQQGIPENFAKLLGEHEALKADVTLMKNAQVREREVAEAMKRLEFRPLGADLEERLVKFHKDFGSKAFHAYVDGLAKSTGVLPKNGAKADAFQGQSDNLPPEVMKFREMGTEKLEQAKRFAAQWEELKAHGLARKSLETYLAINMAKATA